MAVVIQCDRDGCPSRGREETLAGWLTVHPMGGESGDPMEFCSTDCLVVHFARFEIPETIPHD
jgi:hypothetical protein